MGIHHQVRIFGITLFCLGLLGALVVENVLEPRCEGAGNDDTLFSGN